MMLFLKVTEKNQWEGETWRFYFQAPPTHEAGMGFAKLIKHLEGTDYSVAENLIPEAEVDVLVEHDPNHGYMPNHNKIDAELDFDAVLALQRGEELDRALYKGGIRKFAKGAS